MGLWKEARITDKMEKKHNGKIAVIRVRGQVGINRDIVKTLNLLRLYSKNFCVVVPNNKSFNGMVKSVKDYVTWGEINDSVYDMLAEKRGEEYKGRLQDSKGKIKYNSFLDYKRKKIKKFFRLNSPTKGYGRQGTKVSFKVGGALGYRGEKIKDIIERMI